MTQQGPSRVLNVILIAIAFVVPLMAFSIAWLDKNRFSHPRAYKWLARFWCAASPLTLILTACFANSSVRTFGVALLLCFSAFPYIFYRKQALKILKNAEWDKLWKEL